VNGDIINLDVTIYINGFHADLNETYLVGDCDDDSVNLVKTAYDCLSVACAMIKPGTLYRNLGACPYVMPPLLL
jgi:methionyl aminopeptidase